MGLFDTLFGSEDSAPDYTGRAPDAKQQREWYDSQDKQTFSADKTLAGTPQSVQMPEAENFAQSAIQDRARRKYGDYLQDVRNKAQLEEVEQRQRQRIENMDYVSKVQRLVKHVQARRAQAEANKAAARNRVVGGILGLGGAVAGAVIPGGGVMGAYAGSQIGSGLAGNQQMQAGPQYQQGGFSGQSTNYFSNNGSSLADYQRG